MRDAIGDTGPFLHLHEIGKLEVLGVFESIEITDFVEKELERHGLELLEIKSAVPFAILVSGVDDLEWKGILEQKGSAIQPADAQVVALSRRAGEDKIVSTDDLALRRFLEESGITVVGSVGILVRAYRVGVLEKIDLEGSIELLFSESTLHLSEGFRRYVRSLIEDL